MGTERVLVPASDLLIDGVPARTWTTDDAKDYYIPSWVGDSRFWQPEDGAAQMYGRALQMCWKGEDE